MIKLLLLAVVKYMTKAEREDANKPQESKDAAEPKDIDSAQQQKIDVAPQQLMEEDMVVDDEDNTGVVQEKANVSSVTDDWSEEEDIEEDISKLPRSIRRRVDSPNASMYGAQFTDDSMGEFISDTEQDDELDRKAYAKLKPGEIGDLCQPGFPKLAGRAKPGRNEKAADVYAKIDAFYSMSKLKGAFPNDAP